MTEPVKTFNLPDGRQFKLGRNVPTVRYPSLKFSNYLEGITALPVPPATADYTEKAAPSLSQIYLNDQLGDCVVAAVEHVEGVFHGNANPPPILYTDTQTKALYSAACGYNGSPQTDQGCEIQAVLAYWQNKGHPVGSEHKIAGYLSVNPANIGECQLALWLFENLIFGIGLPDHWVNPMPNATGFVWDVAGKENMNNGHCFPAFGYDATGFKISTWAMLGTMTNAAVTKYGVQAAGGELWTVISKEQVSAALQKAPNGLDWASLVADFNALGGKIPVDIVPPPIVVPPAPNTTPIPVPTQPGTGSKAWLQANLPPQAYAAYIQALTHPLRSQVPGTPGWLITHLSAKSYSQLVSSFRPHKEGGTFDSVGNTLEDFYNYLKAEYMKHIG